MVRSYGNGRQRRIEAGLCQKASCTAKWKFRFETRPMSEWTHPVCDVDALTMAFTHEINYPPTRVVEDQREEERCCFCGERTRSGVYLRADPATMPFHRPDRH